MDIKRHKCLHCSGSFTDKTALHTHLMVHAGVKEYSCSKCSKTFAQKTNLNIHMKSVHLKIKPHNCGFCKATFSTLAELKLHSGTHEKHKKYKCRMCPASFAQKGNLLTHINSAKHAGKRSWNILKCPTPGVHIPTFGYGRRPVYLLTRCSKKPLYGHFFPGFLTLKNFKWTGMAIPFSVRIYVIYFSFEIYFLYWNGIHNALHIWFLFKNGKTVAAISEWNFHFLMWYPFWEYWHGP